MAKLNPRDKNVQKAMEAAAQKAGAQRNPFTPDRELAQKLSAPAQRYAAQAKEWLEQYRQQQAALQKAREQQKRAQGLYDASAAYQQQGTTANPTYEQLVAKYYANAPTKGTAYDRIQQLGGFQNLTQKQLQAMMSPEVYKPTEGTKIGGLPVNSVIKGGSNYSAENVSAWEWLTDPQYQQATRNAYINQLTDMQTAMQYGAFDTPQYLLGGHSELVSDEYLKYLQGVLPGLQQEQENAWKQQWDDYYALLDNYEKNKAMFPYRPDDLYELSQYAAVFEDEGNQDADYEFFDNYANEWYSNADEYSAAINTLIEADNALNGTTRDVSYLNGLSSAQRGRELSRMLSQYYEMQLLASGMPNTLEPEDNRYPYDAVMELVSNEIQSREVMAPYLSAVVNAPNFMEQIDYKAPQGELTSEAGSPYVVINNGGMWGASVDTSLMTDMERAVFNYHYNMGDRQGAETYFQAMLPQLAERTRIIERVGWEELATDNIFTGALSWAGVRAANLGSALMYPVDAARAALGTDYGQPGLLSDYSKTVTGAQLGELEDYDWLGLNILGQNIPQWIYSTASTAADMGLAHAAGGMLPWGQAPLAIMGMEAAASDLASTAGSDMEAWERILHSGLVGGLEAATEKLPFDAFTSNPGAKGYLLRNVLSEAGEEAFNAAAGRGVDELTAALAGRKSPTASRIKQLDMQNVENPEAVVAGEFAQEVGAAALGGGLAGFAMGAPVAAMDAAQTSSEGKAVQKAGGEDALIDIGRGMDSKTESAQMAAEMTKTGEKGKKNAARKIGRLYRTLLQETAQEYHDNLRTAAVDAVEQAMDQRYEELGIEKETDYTTREMAEVIVDAQGSKDGVKGEIGKYIKTSRVPQAIMREFGGSDAAWTQEYQVRQVKEKLKYAGKVGAITATARKSGETGGDAEAASPDAIEKETQERVETLTRRKKPSEKMSPTIAFVEDEGRAEVLGSFVRAEGTGSNISIVVEHEGEKKSIPLPRIRQVSAGGIARVIAYAESRPEIQAEEINAMVSVLQETDGKATVKASEVIAAYETGVKAGFVGAERPALSEVVETVIHGKKAAEALETVLEMGYKQGSRESNQAETRRRESAKGQAKGIAAVAYMGEVENTGDVKDTGVRESVETIMNDLTPQQNAAVRALGTLSDATGIGFTLFRTKAADGEELQTPNGFYDPETNSIFIDLQAGQSKGGETMVESAILKTASHELTHYIEMNTQDGYVQLRSATKQLLGKRGQNYGTLIEKKLRTTSHITTRAQAEAEVIADACEMMLKDSTAVQTLAKNNPSLWEKMKNWLKDFARRVKRAFSGLTATSEEAQALTEIRDGVERYVGNIQQLWDNALVEAAGKETAAETTEKTGDVVEEREFSVRTVNGNKVAWVEDDILASKPANQSTIDYIRDYLVDHLDDVYTIVESGYTVQPDRKLPNEYTRSVYTQQIAQNRKLLRAKMRMVSGIGEMLEIATGRKWEKTKHHGNKDAKYGVYKYTARVAFDGKSGIEAYKAKLIILNASDGKKYLYDIDGIKKDVATANGLTQARMSSNAAQQQTNNVNNSIPSSAENVNGNKQFSARRGKPDLSVRDALMAITDTTGMTHAESELLTRYQGNVLKLEEVTEAIAEKTAIRDNKETPEKERTEVKKELWHLKRQKYAIERALIDAENEGGYAKLMTTAGEMVRLLTTKDTLPEVTAALQEQMAKVTEQLAQVQAELGEMAEEDMWNTIRSLFDQTKLRAAAKKLKALYGSRISEKTLMNRIVLMQTTLLRGGKNASAEYLQLGEELVRELRSKAQQDSEMLSILKEHIGTITITEAQRQEINNTIGMKEFLQVVKPVVNVVPKGKASVTLDVLLDEANAAEGGHNPLLPYFEGYEGEGDSIMHLYNLIKGVKTANAYAGRYGQEQLQAEMIDALSIAAEATLVDAGAETVKKVMDALTKNAEGSDALTAKVRQLRIEMAKAGRDAGAAAWKAGERHKAMDDVIQYLTTLEEQNMLLEKADTQRTIERQVKEQSNDRIKEIIAERNVMERNRVMRERIRRTVGWMVTRIRRETDRKNVPEELKPYIEDAIRIFAEYNDVLRVFKKSEIGDIKRIFGELKKYDTKTEGALNDLIEEELDNAFKELRVNLEEYGAAGKAESRKKNLYRNKSLTTIDEIVQMLWGQITKWNEIFIGGKQAQLSDVASETVAGLNTREDYAIRDHAGGHLWEAVKEAARNKNLTPIYFFRLLENKMMQTLNDDIVKAQREYGVMLAEAKKTLEQIQAKHHYWAWKNADPLEFTTEQGRRTKDGKHDISLTVDEAMSIWAIWIREQDTTPLFESTHLSNGGIVLQAGKRRVNGKLVQDSTPHKLSVADMAVIDKWLTAEQKAYAKAIVEYMSKDMAEIGNRASMRMYGIRKFKEEHYFPMGVQRDQLAQSSNKAAKNPDANRIAGMSSAHRRVERAWKPLAIGSFTEVAANHVNDMLLYGTFAVPIENFNTVLNYNYVKNAAGEDLKDEDASSMTIRALFRQKYGSDLTSYLETYLADLNGGTGVRENSKLMSLYKRSAVMASVSVMLQQPLSIIRAWMVQNPKYYLPIINGTAKDPEKSEWEQLCRYSGAAVLKGIGGFDMTSTRTMGGYLAGTAEDTYDLAKKAGALVGVNVQGEKLAGVQRQFDALLGLGAQKADQMAWVYMWRAAKAEVAEQNPSMNTSSEAFLQMAADRFEEVVNLTQVYDSTLVRSQNMRSKSNWTKAVTSFMAEPTLTWNMLMDGWNTGNKKAIVKSVGIFLLSQVATAMVKSLWTAGRKEDEEKPWLEKYLAAVGGELGGYGGSLNPLNLIPYARDAMSLLEGYDVERADMVLVDQLLDEAKKWMSGKYEDKPEEGAKNMAFALSNLLGIPMKNIWRDVTTGINTWKDATEPRRAVNTMVLTHEAVSNFLPWVDVSSEAYYTRLYQAMQAGDTKEVEALREFLGTQGKGETAVNSGVKKVVKAQLAEGNMTEAQAKAFMLEHGLAADEKAAFQLVDGWKEKAENAGNEEYNYSEYNTVREAIDSGNAKAVEAAVKELVDNGWNEKSVYTEVHSYLKEQYLAGALNQAQVKTFSSRDEWNDNDWYWYFRELDWGKANGGSTEGWNKYNGFYSAVETGKDLRAVVKEYRSHGVEAKTLAGNLTTTYKDEFVRLYKTNKTAAANLQARLLNAYAVLGYDRAKKQRDIAKWLEE